MEMKKNTGNDTIRNAEYDVNKIIDLKYSKANNCPILQDEVKILNNI